MKKILFLGGGFILALALCSCGSLTQHVGGEKLSPAALEFAHRMREEPSWPLMGKTYDGAYHETDKWYADVVPFLVFWNWTTLGSFDHDQTLVVRKVAIFFPVFYSVGDSRYNGAGIRQDTGLEWNLACVIGYENFHTRQGDRWKNGLLWIPGVGPCLGWGPGYFQFLWLPLVDTD
ncbi:MAG: hypothetical protein PHQ27_07905 [Victivallales bacterium]|nr:hypothetical protein [Victivallales bacterium]